MTDGWRDDRRVAGVLDVADVLHVAVSARRGPHVTPTVFDVAGGRLWFVTPRRSVKARVIARHRRVGGLVQAGDRALVFGGRARIVDPLTARGVLSPGRFLELPLAAAGYFDRNLRHALGTVRDHPAPTLALSRVMVSIDVRRAALLDGPAVVEAWGRWARTDLLLAGDPSPGRAPDLRAAPPALRALLGDGAGVVLGWQSLSGPLALPGRWQTGAATVETSAEALVLAGAGTAGPACVTAQRSRYRLDDKEGVLVSGAGEARRPAGDPVRARVAIDAQRATWWTGEHRRSVQMATNGPGCP